MIQSARWVTTARFWSLIRWWKLKSYQRAAYTYTSKHCSERANCLKTSVNLKDVLSKLDVEPEPPNPHNSLVWVFERDYTYPLRTGSSSKTHWSMPHSAPQGHAWVSRVRLKLKGAVSELFLGAFWAQSNWCISKQGVSICLRNELKATPLIQLHGLSSLHLGGHEVLAVIKLSCPSLPKTTPWFHKQKSTLLNVDTCIHEDFIFLITALTRLSRVKPLLGTK